MADVNIFDKYGIKEVANVYFEALDDDISAGVYKGDIVLFLDTLKVSTIETSAENVAATGGWGNPRLIQWDYGKEINVTLTDALISLESLRFMLGGAIHKDASADKPIIVHHTAEVTCVDGGVVPLPTDPITKVQMTPSATEGHPIRLINLTTGTRTQISATVSGSTVTPQTMTGETSIIFKNTKLIGTETGSGETTVNKSQATKKGDKIRIFWEEILTGDQAEKETAVEVTISPNTFPGQYRVVGDTFMRNQATGKDEPFQFVINNAKVQSNVTITLEAEGDPSTFDLTLTVLRSGSDEMMKLVRYSVDDTDNAEIGDDEGSFGS